MKKRKLTSRADLQPGEPLLWKRDGHTGGRSRSSTKSVGVYVTFSPDTRLRLEVATDVDVEKLDDRGVDKDHVDSDSDYEGVDPDHVYVEESEDDEADDDHVYVEESDDDEADEDHVYVEESEDDEADEAYVC